ncbi:MFS transporter [Paenibacillus rhizoplanae]
MSNKTAIKEVPSIPKGPILFVMILGAFLATLNQTIMSVATPELMHDFNITAATAQWLTTGYMLVNGVLIPITAYLMQRFTTRELFQASMFIFLCGYPCISARRQLPGAAYRTDDSGCRCRHYYAAAHPGYF